MKAAVVLNADSLNIAQQAGEIRASLEAWECAPRGLELWLCYRRQPPQAIPNMGDDVPRVRAIGVQGPEVPESYLHALEPVARKQKIDLLLFGSDDLSAELATRLAYRLNGSSCLRVTACNLSGDRPQVVKPVYGNHLAARFALERAPYCLSVEKQSYRPVGRAADLIPCGTLLPVPVDAPAFVCDWIKEMNVTPAPAAHGLKNAEAVLVVGQGVKDKASLKMLRTIADTIGTELGASRPVVMKAWTDMNRLVGALGLILSPKLCIAAGVSGTAVFSVGIENSELIVAINTDAAAPIFNLADVGIVGDLHAVLPALADIIEAADAHHNHTKRRDGADR